VIEKVAKVAAAIACLLAVFPPAALAAAGSSVTIAIGFRCHSIRGFQGIWHPAAIVSTRILFWCAASNFRQTFNPLQTTF
jgi:hypothetical protein